MRTMIGLAIVVAIGLVWSAAAMSKWVPAARLALPISLLTESSKNAKRPATPRNGRFSSLFPSNSLLRLRQQQGRGAMRQFRVGEVVTWIPEALLRYETHGDYRIVAAMPDRDGDHFYRIKSPLEEYERVVKESLLIKSVGYLPEARRQRPRRSSITLPTLQGLQ